MAHKSLGNNPDFVNARIMRQRFHQIKRSSAFNVWKQNQYRVQERKCAWCLEPMPEDMSNIHVDHALALFHGGSNQYSNLVLAHGRCNVQKWIRIDGVPQWILNNQAKHQRIDLLMSQQELFEQLDFDRRLWHWMSQWV